MTQILITGMSGAGKSPLLAELARRGHRTIDPDYDGWTMDDRLWDSDRMRKLLDCHMDLVVSGTVENQGDFYDRFAQIVLLTVPVNTLIERVRTRTNNPYGHTEARQDEIRRYVREVEPLFRNSATMELNGRLSIAELANAVETLLAE